MNWRMRSVHQYLPQAGLRLRKLRSPDLNRVQPTVVVPYYLYSGDSYPHTHGTNLGIRSAIDGHERQREAELGALGAVDLLGMGEELLKPGPGDLTAMGAGASMAKPVSQDV